MGGPPPPCSCSQSMSFWKESTQKHYYMFWRLIKIYLSIVSKKIYLAIAVNISIDNFNFLLLCREASVEKSAWSSFRTFFLLEFHVPAVDKHLVKTGASLKFLDLSFVAMRWLVELCMNLAANVWYTSTSEKCLFQSGRRRF